MKRFELNPIKCMCMFPIDEDIKMHIIQSFTELLTVQKKALDLLSSMAEKDLQMGADSTDSSVDIPPSQSLPPELENLPEILRRKEIMNILKISQSTYYRHIKNGLLTPRKLGKQNYFHPTDLINALEYSKVHGYL